MAGRLNFRWAWIPVAIIAADQATKLAVHHLTPEEYLRPVIPGLLNLVHRHNPGVAFGLLADAESPLLRVVLLLFAVAAVSTLTWLLATDRAGEARSRAGLAMILGGAAGNALDRILHHGVVDFIDFHIGARHWPAFNVADSCIVIGAGLVILELLFEKQRPEENSPERSAQA